MLKLHWEQLNVWVHNKVSNIEECKVINVNDDRFEEIYEFDCFH